MLPFEKWRHRYAGAVNMLLRLVHGSWPVPDPPRTALELRQWLKERSLKSPAHILYHRTGLVERYIRWLQEQRVIASNPFAELHLHYGPRTTSIVHRR